MKGLFVGFNLIYWVSMCGRWFLVLSLGENVGKYGKIGGISGRLRPDWGNTTWAAMVGLESKGYYQTGIHLRFMSH